MGAAHGNTYFRQWHCSSLDQAHSYVDSRECIMGTHVTYMYTWKRHHPKADAAARTQDSGNAVFMPFKHHVPSRLPEAGGQVRVCL